MEGRDWLCPRCGCLEYREVDESHLECAECGLGATVSRVTFSGRDTAAPPDPDHLQFLEDQRTMARIAVAELPFPPFALDDRWMGPRSLGGHGIGGHGTVSITLTHGEPLADRGPLIRVGSERPESLLTAEVAIQFKARSLVRELWRHTGALRDDVRRAAFPGEQPTDATAPWEHTTLPVEGRDTSASVLTEGDWWVALLTIDGLVVDVVARSWPYDLTGLERAGDLSPYDLAF